MYFHPTSLLAQSRGRKGRSGFTLIELLVVIGIVALLLTVASTAFFGATKQESVTKSRNQLRDVLLMARQQACILGKPHVVVCWNTDATITVGNSEQTGLKQGRYALFQYIGQVWGSGRDLAAPFGVQREILSGALRRNARLINLNKPNDEKFMRVDALPNDSTRTADENNRQNISPVDKLEYEYFVGGTAEKFEPPTTDKQGYDDSKNYKFLVARLRNNANERGAFPAGVRVTETYSLPQLYKFSQDRAVFYFSADGRLVTSGVDGVTQSISAAHSVSRGKQDLTFSVSVDQNGIVKVSN